MDTPDYKKLLDEAEEENRKSSLNVFQECGPSLPQKLVNGEVLALIDRAYARSYLTKNDHKLPKFKAAQKTLLANEIVLLFSVLSCVSIGFTYSILLGVGLLFAIPAFVLFNWRSTQLPRGKSWAPKISILFCAMFLVYLFTIGADWKLVAFTLGLILISSSSLIRYLYPRSVINEILLEQPNTAPDLIDTLVLNLLYKRDAPRGLLERGY